MSHVRQQVRTAFVDRLQGLPITGTNVFDARRRPIAAGAAPAILVYTNNEELTYTVGDVAQRAIAVTVSIIAQALDDIDALLDTISMHVEYAISSLPLVGFPSQLVSLQSVETEVDTSGDQLAGTMTLNYLMNIFTQTNAPEIAL